MCCGGYGRESLIGEFFFCFRGQAKKEFKVEVSNWTCSA